MRPERTLRQVVALALLAGLAVAPTAATAQVPNQVTITANNQVAEFLAGLATPGTTVRVANNVQLDLSNRQSLPIADGVTLVGGRTARQPGPLLYTRTRPRILFTVEGDRVRITGVRIRGPDMGAPSSGETVAIISQSHVPLEIDHNELFGWRGEAIEILDDQNRISTRDHRVRVHDNYIHHNQHVGRLGYGVVVSNGAWVEIERNVFDWNRHAIAGDGSNGSGYRAFDNLVLPNGGLHRWIPFPGVWFRTHQFDMHGQRTCGAGSIFSDTLFNCGRAGFAIDVYYNSFLYKHRNPTGIITRRDVAAIKLRGTPERRPCGASVVSNVFAHDSIREAVQQTERGLCLSRNVLNVNSLRSVRVCDVDGDQVRDSFLATGQTWWYANARTGPWTFLRRSTSRPSACPPPGSLVPPA
jgi:hypothetical protein